jgi:hypothetical protein
MRQEDVMPEIKSPLIVMPPVYEMPMQFWRWCRLTEVCEIAVNVSGIMGPVYRPTPEELVRNFAVLTRRNKGFKNDPLRPDQNTQGANKPSIKLFRYTVDGRQLMAKEVVNKNSTYTDPPYVDFQLDNVPFPYPDPLYVPEGWALDTLRAIRQGAIRAMQWGSLVIQRQKPLGGYDTVEFR